MVVAAALLVFPGVTLESVEGTWTWQFCTQFPSNLLVFGEIHQEDFRWEKLTKLELSHRGPWGSLPHPLLIDPRSSEMEDIWEDSGVYGTDWYVQASDWLNTTDPDNQWWVGTGIGWPMLQCGWISLPRGFNTVNPSVNWSFNTFLKVQKWQFIHLKMTLQV